MTPDTPHTVHRFDRELAGLRDLIERMGKIAVEQIRAAVRAVMERDADLAAEVAARDKELDRLEREVEAEVIKVLALRHPVASDLRLVIGALRAANDLERIGDYAANVAKRGILLAELPPLGSLNGFGRLADMAGRNVEDAVAALLSGDADLADRVWAGDQPVDAIYTGIFREMLTHMMEDPRTITAATHFLFVAKNLERIGDHATNIAEVAHYLGRGEFLEGERPKADTTVAPDGTS